MFEPITLYLLRSSFCSFTVFSEGKKGKQEKDVWIFFPIKEKTSHNSLSPCAPSAENRISSLRCDNKNHEFNDDTKISAWCSSRVQLDQHIAGFSFILRLSAQFQSWRSSPSAPVTTEDGYFFLFGLIKYAAVHFETQKKLKNSQIKKQTDSL